MLALIVAGRRYYCRRSWTCRSLSFSLALLFSTLSILSIGFLIASIVADGAVRAADRRAAVLSDARDCRGLFFPVEALPPTLRLVARALPLTYAVSLMKGIWRGEGWLAHGTDVAALVLTMVICIALSAKWFRWE